MTEIKRMYSLEYSLRDTKGIITWRLAQNKYLTGEELSDYLNSPAGADFSEWMIRTWDISTIPLVKVTPVT